MINNNNNNNNKEHEVFIHDEYKKKIINKNKSKPVKASNSLTFLSNPTAMVAVISL
jgi:hypothetical protein